MSYHHACPDRVEVHVGERGVVRIQERASGTGFATAVPGGSAGRGDIGRMSLISLVYGLYYWSIRRSKSTM